jgi:GT2 family glycosyltransferase
MALPVSIVIPSFNRNRLLQLMVESYLRQGCAECIVVDDGSDPPVDPIDSTDGTAVRLIRLDRRGNVPAARMAGVRAATQKYIFFGEDDAFLSSGCIESLLGFIQSGRFDLVAPRCITVKNLPTPTSTPEEGRRVTRAAEIIDYRLIQIDYSCQPQAPIEVPWLHSLALMSRETVLNIGYDSAYRGNAYREETDFFIRAKNAGARLAFVPGPPIFHYKGPILSNASREIRRLPYIEFWVARNNFYFLRKNRVSLRIAGATAMPLADTLLLIIRRVRWYWRRFLRKLFLPADRPTEAPL